MKTTFSVKTWGILFMFLVTMAMTANSKTPSSTGRVAIIIGNQEYEASYLKLNKVYNDVYDTKTTLSNIGFHTEVLATDLAIKPFTELLQALCQKIPEAECLFFYFSGHGLQIKGENYLVPTDFHVEGNYDNPESQLISLDSIYHYLDLINCPTKIIVLDACREIYTATSEDKSGRRSLTRTGLYEMITFPKITPSGTYTMFAAKAKSLAFENYYGQNSFFTGILLKNLIIPNLTITAVFRETKVEVERQTNGKQEPCALDNLANDFILSVKKRAKQTLLENKNRLEIEVSTNHGNKDITYYRGETMRLTYRVNKPCYVRLIYRLTTGELVLLNDDFHVITSESGQWKTLESQFVCSPPFGYENLYAIASERPFLALETERTPQGYKLIKMGLVNTLSRTLNIQEGTSGSYAQDQLLILTKE